jgi:hypothetical protein
MQWQRRNRAMLWIAARSGLADKHRPQQGAGAGLRWAVGRVVGGASARSGRLPAAAQFPGECVVLRPEMRGDPARLAVGQTRYLTT